MFVARSVIFGQVVLEEMEPISFTRLLAKTAQLLHLRYLLRHLVRSFLPIKNTMSLAVDLDPNPFTRQDLMPLVVTGAAESGTTITTLL